MRSIDTTFLPPHLWVAEQLERLPSRALRRAVVLTPNEALAHSVRRFVCVDLRRPDLLAGVRFQPPVGFARELLAATGRACLPGGEARRRLSLLHQFTSRILAGRLRYFDALQLQSSPGYADAFAATIGELEAGGLDAEAVFSVVEMLQADGEDRDAARLHDVALAWQQADADAGSRATASQVLSAAADELRDGPSAATAYGPVVVVLSGAPTTALLRFVDALPLAMVVLQEARPWRSQAQRWRETVALALPDDRPLDAAAPTELAVLQRFLFELPEVLTAPARARSLGADGSVSFERYAGIEDEVEATAKWVAECLIDGVPPERVAVVLPQAAGYAALLGDRLQRLAHGGQPLAIHCPGGTSLATTPAGTRIKLVLNALARCLEAQAMAHVLPLLRRPGQGREGGASRLSPSRAVEMIAAAGIVGGSPRDSVAIAEWVPRLTRQADRLRALVSAVAGAEPLASSDGLARRNQQMSADTARQSVREVDGLLPAISALQAVALQVAAGAPLDELWEGVASFCERHLALPPEPAGIVALAREHLRTVIADPAAREIRGRDALHCLDGLLVGVATPTPRFGSPAIFVGSAADAAGLEFDCVRILGLAEGGLPRTPHDDPVLPDELRGKLDERARDLAADVVIPGLADRVLDEIHDVYRVAQAARIALVLSAPRQWLDRSERELSGVVLEAATALGRGSAANGDGDVPTAARLRSAYFQPDGRRCNARALGLGATPRSVLTAVADRTGQPGDAIHAPLGWRAPGALDVERLVALADVGSVPGPQDGAIGAAWQLIDPPGLGRRPISATAMARLLECPHRFLLERLLHWRAPASPLPSDRIDPERYGRLFHAVAQEFFGRFGASVCAHQGELGSWIAQIQALGEVALDDLLESYPIRGGDNLRRERVRLLEQLAALVREEWQRAPREFVAAEAEFGQEGEVTLAAADRRLRLWGAMDRIDRLGPVALAVRDLKTGRVADLVDEPIRAARDLQLGLYVMVLEAEGADRGDKVQEASYVHPSPTLGGERAFSGASLERLRAYTRGWLRVTESLLRTGNLVRTPNAEDCEHCPFQPACGDSAQRVSTAQLDGLSATHDLALFVRMKRSELSR